MDSFITHLKHLEQTETPLDQIESTILPYLNPETTPEPTSIITLYIYLLEFKIRHFTSSSPQTTSSIRTLFTTALTTVTSLNLPPHYIDTLYHMWAEFETYKTKNIQMLHKLMTTFCHSDKSIHSFRAYIYYIKTIGTDFHHPGHQGLCALRVKEMPQTSFDIAAILRSGDYVFEIGGDTIVLP